MPRIIGIDLGTTSSAIAVMNRDAWVRGNDDDVVDAEFEDAS